jgi:hypothetical protein
LRYALAVPCAARRARAGANSRIPALEHARLSPAHVLRCSATPTLGVAVIVATPAAPPVVGGPAGPKLLLERL